MNVMRHILSQTIDAKSAGLFLYALRTASLNLRRADLEPLTRERVVIDPDSIHETPFGSAWELEDLEDDEEGESTLDPDGEESLADDDEDDDEEEEEEEDENEDSDDDDEDSDSNEPEDEEEDGPPLYVEPDSVSPTLPTLPRLPTI